MAKRGAKKAKGQPAHHHQHQKQTVIVNVSSRRSQGYGGRRKKKGNPAHPRNGVSSYAPQIVSRPIVEMYAPSMMYNPYQQANATPILPVPATAAATYSTPHKHAVATPTPARPLSAPATMYSPRSEASAPPIIVPVHVPPRRPPPVHHLPFDISGIEPRNLSPHLNPSLDASDYVDREDGDAGRLDNVFAEEQQSPPTPSPVHWRRPPTAAQRAFLDRQSSVPGGVLSFTGTPPSTPLTRKSPSPLPESGGVARRRQQIEEKEAEFVAASGKKTAFAPIPSPGGGGLGIAGGGGRSAFTQFSGENPKIGKFESREDFRKRTGTEYMGNARPDWWTRPSSLPPRTGQFKGSLSTTRLGNFNK